MHKPHTRRPEKLAISGLRTTIPAVTLVVVDGNFFNIWEISMAELLKDLICDQLSLQLV